MPPKAIGTRSSGDVGVHPDVLFPAIPDLQPTTQLPTVKTVIGILRHLTIKRVSHNDAVREVSKIVYSKWFHDTVYCVPFNTVLYKVEKLWEIFREGKKRLASGQGGKAVEKYKEKVVNLADNLFDIGAVTVVQINKCKDEWGVMMTEQDYSYYQDQKTSRAMHCDHGVDPVWYYAVMRAERQRNREEDYKKKRKEQFQYKSMDQITEILTQEGLILSNSDISIDTPTKDNTSKDNDNNSQNEEVKKRRLFSTGDQSDSADVPPRMAHVRDSERKVADKFYITCGNLVGHGMSLNESMNAIVEVGNGMFERSWKMPGTDPDKYDKNTLPDKRNIRQKLNLIETETMSFAVDNIFKARADGREITAAIDSTTKRGVGTFATQGIHIGKNPPIPLPLLGIVGETTEEIAKQVQMGIEILAAAKGLESKEVYRQITVHMTDSVAHNKGFAAILAELHDLDKPAGQIFCGSHTTLGFSNALNKRVSVIETDMKVETVLSKFMVTMELDSKNGSLAGQSLDMMLKLVAPEFAHKVSLFLFFLFYTFVII